MNSILFLTVVFLYLSKLSRQSTLIEELINIRIFFSDILLVTKYNFDCSFKLVDIHDRIWSKVFLHRLYVGPWKEQQIESFKEKLNNSAMFLQLNDKFGKGIVAYETLIQVMNNSINYGNFTGYFYKHDDMAINMRSLYQKLNLSKHYIWASYRHANPGTVHLNSSVIDGWPWDDFFGKPAALNIISNNENIRKKLINCTGDINKWYVGDGDLMYIPKTESKNFIEVFSYFLSYNFFLEMAIPTFFECFSTIPFQTIPMCGLRMHLDIFYKGNDRYFFILFALLF